MKATGFRSTKRRATNRWLPAALLLAWPLLFAESASAQTFWVADGVGNWNVAANWSGGTPHAAKSAAINNGGTARLFDPGAWTNFIVLGHNPGNSGTLEVLGGRVVAEKGIVVGFDGMGELKIANGGSAASFFDDLQIGLFFGSSGTATIDGPGSNWNGGGPFSVGARGAGTLSVQNGGAVSNTDGYVGEFAGSTGTAAVDGLNSRWVNSGDLYVGFEGDGALNVTGGGEVSNLSANIGAAIGSVSTATVNGAGSVWTNNSVLAVGSSGAGALNITGGGVVTSTNGRVGREAGSTGTVLIDGPGSRWNASGAVTMGLVNTGTATLSVQNGGVLSAAGGMTVGPLGRVRGDGTIVGNVSIGGGTVAPGMPPGTLHITGNYEQSFGAKLQIELASPTSFDKLAVTGNITLAFGGALQVSLIDGYVPHGSQSFDILNWDGALSGTFSSIQLPTLGGTLVWNTSQLYTTGVLSVIGPSLEGPDFNRDGDVDGDDLVVWQEHFGAIDAEPQQGDADADHDVDGADFLAWQRQLGSSLAATPVVFVPEPSSLALLIVGVPLLTRRHRNRGLQT